MQIELYVASEYIILLDRRIRVQDIEWLSLDHNGAITGFRLKEGAGSRCASCGGEF